MRKSVWAWLEEKGYTCFRNISIGGKFPDVLGVKNKTIVAVEIKKRASELTKAIGQCLHYLQKANVVYIAFPSKEIDFISANTREMLKTYGVGLMAGSPTVEMVVEPKKTHKKNTSLIEKLKRTKQKEKKSPSSYKDSDIRESIINLLREHPEGLTILNISKHIGITRQTASKYMYGLISEGIVKIRKIGPAKLCYLRRMGRKSGKK